MKVLKEEFGGYTNLDFIEGAAWTKERKLKLFGLVEDDRGAMTQGASVVADHNSGDYAADEEATIEVDTFSLAELLNEKVGA